MALFQIGIVLSNEGNIDQAITLVERAVEIDEAIQFRDLEWHREVLARLRAKTQNRGSIGMASAAPEPELVCPCGSGVPFLDCHGQEA